MSNLSLNFKNSIEKILSETSAFGSLKKNGMDLLNKMLDSLNSRLVRYCLDYNNANTMNVLTARNAVKEIFSGELKRHAFAEGNRIVILYNANLVEYKPQVKYTSKILDKRKIRDKKEIKKDVSKLSKGILDITASFFPNARLQDLAKEIISEMIEGLALNFSDFIRSRKKSSITQEDVRAASIRILPQELSKHALAEGARMILLHETGILEEPSRKRIDERVKRKRVPRIAAEKEPKISRIPRKRKRPPSKISRSPKRRRKLSTKKVSKRTLTPKRKRKKTVSKVSRKKPLLKKRIIPRKISRKKRASVKTVPRKTVKPRAKRKKAVSKKVTRKKRVPRKVRKPRAPLKRRRKSRRVTKKPRKSRKRKRSPSETTSRSPKRRRKISPRKISKKIATPKTKRRKAVSRVSRKRPISQKKIPSKKVAKKKSKRVVERKAAKTRVTRKRKPSRKVARKKRVSRKTVQRKAAKPRVSRKKRITKRKIPRKRPIRLLPKKVRKISKKEYPKKKAPREEKITITAVKEINRGTRKLNEVYHQNLPPQTLKVIVKCLSNLLDTLIEEMRRHKYLVIGPEDVRRVVIKVFPRNLADLAIAHMCQIIMNSSKH